MSLRQDPARDLSLRMFDIQCAHQTLHEDSIEFAQGSTVTRCDPLRISQGCIGKVRAVSSGFRAHIQIQMDGSNHQVYGPTRAEFKRAEKDCHVLYKAKGDGAKDLQLKNVIRKASYLKKMQSRNRSAEKLNLELRGAPDRANAHR